MDKLIETAGDSESPKWDLLDEAGPTPAGYNLLVFLSPDIPCEIVTQYDSLLDIGMFSPLR